MCLCVAGDYPEGAPAIHSAGGQGASPGLARHPTGETPPAARDTDAKDTADTLAQGDTNQIYTFTHIY